MKINLLIVTLLIGLQSNSQDRMGELLKFYFSSEVKAIINSIECIDLKKEKSYEFLKEISPFKFQFVSKYLLRSNIVDVGEFRLYYNQDASLNLTNLGLYFPARDNLGVEDFISKILKSPGKRISISSIDSSSEVVAWLVENYNVVIYYNMNDTVLLIQPNSQL
jgi:hypothetical protein